MDVFADNIDLIKELSPEKRIAIDRLKFIHQNTENSWLANLEFFENNEVKYILMCEAPPYSETEIPIYFYNQISNFQRKIWKVFFKEEKMPDSLEETLKRFAGKGFLLVDNLPFSMKFESTQRRKKTYTTILQNSLPWVINKLNNEKIKFSTDVKIAFGFKLNALQFLKVSNGQLNLKNLILRYDENNICSDGSGFPNSAKLDKIFFADITNEFLEYKYYNGESENPYLKQSRNPLDFSNPRSLFWHYEKHFYFSLDKTQCLHEYIENLIHSKLSEFYRSDYKLWEMYFKNAIK